MGRFTFNRRQNASTWPEQQKMTIPLASSNWQGQRVTRERSALEQPAPQRAPARGLEPQVLREAGILLDTRRPQDALRRGWALARQGHFRQVYKLLKPHVDRTSGRLQLQLTELYARSAAAIGRKWERELQKALDGYKQAGDAEGEGRCLEAFGHAALNAGKLAEADRQLADAEKTLRASGKLAGALSARALRARGRLYAGDLNQAQSLLEGALSEARHRRQRRAEAFARLERGRVYAARGELTLAARDVLLAERVFGSSGNRADVVRAKLVRAEMLLACGQWERAARGLRRLQAEAAHLEDLCMRAWSQELLGRALLPTDAAGARRYLSRSRHLYEKVGAHYEIAVCDVAMARVELRLGLNPRDRLRKTQRAGLDQWPAVWLESIIAQAELDAPKAPEKARQTLRQVRDDALELGHHTLASQADRSLRSDKGAELADVAELTPVDPQTRSALAERSRTTQSQQHRGPAQASRPTPMDEASPGAQVRPYPSSQRQMLGANVAEAGKPALRRPKVAGVRAR